jgi:hypothetical protein
MTKRPVLLLFVASSAMCAAAGCEVIFGFKRAELYVSDAGSGASTTTTTTTTTSTSTSTSTSSSAPCTPGDTKSCYTGPAGTEDAGACMGGIAACDQTGQWGACAGETLPQPRSCASTADVACLGKDNCTQWAELFGSLAGAQAVAVGVDGTGNVYVMGVFAGSIVLPQKTLTAAGSSDIFLLKLDPTGVPLWGKDFSVGVSSYAVPALLSMSVDAAGDIALSGECSNGTYSFDGIPAGPGFWAAKLTSDGTVLWANGLRTHGSTGGFAAASALTPTGDVVIGGTVPASTVIDFGDGPITATGQMGFVATLRGSDGSGKAADGGWNQILCNGNLCDVAGVAVDGMGNVLLAATFQDNLTFGTGTSLITVAGTNNAALAKLAPNGSPTWIRQIGDPNGGNQAVAVSFGIDGSGGPILAGTFSGNVDFGSGTPVVGPQTGPPYAFVAHYGADKSFTSAAALPNASIVSVAGDTAGNVFLAGSFTGPTTLGGNMLTVAGTADVLVAKLSNAGAFLWNKAYGMTGTQQATALAVTGQGAPVVAGYTASPINFGLGTLTPAATNGVFDAFVAELSP